MKKNLKAQNSSIHLYNPKREGLGSYDIHYINAYKKMKAEKGLNQMKATKRYVA